MVHRTRVWALALCCAASLTVQAQQTQTPAANKYSPTNEPYKTKTPSKGNELAAAAQAQLADAMNMIKSLNEESKRYRDQTLRVRIQARAAHALWDANKNLASEWFKQAWEVAEKEDQGATQAAEQARKGFLNSGGGLTILPPAANLRSEVLKLVMQRDPSLGDKFLSQIDEAKEQDTGAVESKATVPAFFDPTEPKLATAKRLELALQLLEAGDIEQAKTFATPALHSVTSPGIIFLCNLRQKEARGADDLYVRLLKQATDDQAADATTVSLLSSYVFTPNLLVTATRRGRMANQFIDVAQTYTVSSELRAKFFDAAANILLRPLPADDQDQTSAGRAGTYFTIARLLPLFEQFASSHVPALTARLTLLAPDAPETFRNGEESMLRMGLTPGGNDDTVPNILSQLDAVATSAERDALYVKAIRTAAISGDPRIREFAEKIENVELKGRARSFADLAVIRSAINKKDVDGGLRIVREGYLAPLPRIWALAQIAGLVKKSDPARAIQLLNDAAAEAKRINLGEAERVYALVCIAVPLFEIDRMRSWDIAADVAKSANAVTSFNVEEGRLSARLRTRNVIAMITSDEPSFNAANLFSLLAEDDLQRAVSVVDTLSSEAPRAVIKLAVARSILSKQKSTTPSMRR
jgi:hypothetical protein